VRGRRAATLQEDSSGQRQPRPVSELHIKIGRANKVLESGLGSLLLLMAALTSLALANFGSTAPAWMAFWARPFGPTVGGHVLTMQGWVNEGLMALFFFSVGLELKREMTEGVLASPSKAALPCIAALGGMIIPMLVYAAVNVLLPGGSMAGITIPMATDIAFAMGVFRVFSRRMPSSAAPFLLTLATVDDLGAILVIAVFFANHLKLGYLAAGAAILASAALAGRSHLIRSASGFTVPGIALWYCLLKGGVNADIAGVLMGFCVPSRTDRGGEIIARLVTRWTLACTLIILPLFALANCAIPLACAPHVGPGLMASGAVTIPLGVALGLVIGKPLGIFLFSKAGQKLGIASLPTGMTKRHLFSVGLLGSVGFTMCLFLTQTSLHGRTAQVAKLAIFGGSFLGACVAMVTMRCLPVRSAEESESEKPHLHSGHA